MKRFLLKPSKDFFRWGHRSNYDWMLFLTSLTAFVWVQTHDLMLTRQTLSPIDHGSFFYYNILMHVL